MAVRHDEGEDIKVKERVRGGRRLCEDRGSGRVCNHIIKKGEVLQRLRNGDKPGEAEVNICHEGVAVQIGSLAQCNVGAADEADSGRDGGGGRTLRHGELRGCGKRGRGDG